MDEVALRTRGAARAAECAAFTCTRRPIRKKLILSQKIKTPMGKIQSILKGLKLAHLAPETPAIANMVRVRVRVS